MSGISRKLRRGMSQDIKFVGSSQTQNPSASTTLVINKPTGTVDGDLMLAFCYNDKGTSPEPFTAPAGWTVFADSITDDVATGWVTTIFWKIAASEDASYTFSNPGSARNSGAIITYRNAKIGFRGSFSTKNTNAVLPEVKIPTNNCILLASIYSFRPSTTLGTPSGMSSVVADSGNTAPSYNICSQTVNTGLTGTRTTSTTPTESRTFGILLFIVPASYTSPTITFVNSASNQNTSSGITQLTINKPTGTVENDLMIAFCMCTSAETWTGDTGWTEIADFGSRPSLRIAYKIATASEASSYTFTTGTTTNTPSGSILTYRNATYDTIGSFVSSADPLTIASINIADNYSRLIACFAKGALSITILAPIYMSAIVTENDATDPSYTISDQLIGYGASSARTATIGSSTYVSGIMLSIKPTS